MWNNGEALETDEKVELTIAPPKDNDGKVLAVDHVDWFSSDETVVTVVGSGLTALATTVGPPADALTITAQVFTPQGVGVYTVDLPGGVEEAHDGAPTGGEIILGAVTPR